MAKVNKVEVEIVATDEASPKIDRLEKKIDGLESDEARVVVTADISRLEKQIAGTKRLMEDLEGDELTVRARMLGNLEEDLEAARRLFDQLDGQTGTVRIAADTRDAVNNIDTLTRSADGGKNALANMIGNTTQDLGAMGGVAGSAGVAIGQMAEYAADAALATGGLRAALTGMATVAGPIAAISLAIAGINSVLTAYRKQAEATAKVEAFNVENVEQFVQLAREGVDIIEGLVGAAREAGKIEVAPNADQQTEALRLLAEEGERLAELIQRMRAEGDAFDFRSSEDGLVDITDLLRRASLSAEDFFRAASDPGKMDQFIERVRRSNLTLDEQASLLSAVIYQTDQYAQGIRSAAEDLAVFGAEGEGVADAAAMIDQAIRQAAEGTDLAATNARRFGADGVENMGAVEEAADDVADAVSSIRDEWQLLMGTLDKREAIRNAQEALEELPKAAAAAWIAADENAADAQEKFRDYEAAIDDVIRKLIAAGTDPITINTVLETIEQGKINEALAIAQAKLDKTPGLRVSLSLNTEAINRRIDENLNVRLIGAPPPQTLSFAPAPANVMIINPPGTPAATAGQLTIFQSRNGER